MQWRLFAVLFYIWILNKSSPKTYIYIFCHYLFVSCCYRPKWYTQWWNTNRYIFKNLHTANSNHI